MKKRKITCIAWLLVLCFFGLGLNSIVWAQSERKSAVHKESEKAGFTKEPEENRSEQSC